MSYGTRMQLQYPKERNLRGVCYSDQVSTRSTCDVVADGDGISSALPANSRHFDLSKVSSLSVESPRHTEYDTQERTYTRFEKVGENQFYCLLRGVN